MVTKTKKLIIAGVEGLLIVGILFVAIPVFYMAGSVMCEVWQEMLPYNSTHDGGSHKSHSRHTHHLYSSMEK